VIEYLQEEIKVLWEQLGRRPRFSDDQRRRLGATAARVGRQRLNLIASIVTPRNLLRWRQRLIARKYDGSSERPLGRPRTPKEIGEGLDALRNELAPWRSS